MFVYNITIKVEPKIETEWLKWQKCEHIPEIMATGLFTDYKFFRLLEEEETDGVTYIIQYFISSFERYKKYIEIYAPLLRKKSFEKWGNQFIAFRTIMQTVN
ncbi:MAG TPA: DUF4286 family protein [Chitinophagaceae bacterium]|jgi:hypothetical protein|nr:DUF4286 family protein [Chitinophagaceae bacterium]